MKTVQVNIDYTEEVNSTDRDWLNTDARICDILVRDDNAETIKYSSMLTQQQIEHIIFLIQGNYTDNDIQDQICEYEIENFYSDLKFLKGLKNVVEEE